MLSVDHLAPTTKTALITRLKTIAGQARGIAQMLEADRDCREIMDQLLALRAATQSVTLEALTAFGAQCLQAGDAGQEQNLSEFLAMVARLTRS